MDEQLGFIIDERSWRDGVSWPVIASVVVHVALIIWVVKNYHPVSSDGAAATPMARYVVLMKQNPQFTEAPGQKVDKARMNAPFSDANRKAAMPKPTGDQPTLRPGDNAGTFVPPAARGNNRQPSPAQPSAATAAASQQPAASQLAQKVESNPLSSVHGANDMPAYQPLTRAAAASGPVNWNAAIKEVGKVASLGGGNSDSAPDFGNNGGDKGYAENGPVSFETQWFDWGDYAQGMVSRIRVHWISGMPELLKTGLKGVVTIRFTIHRDGRISDVTILQGSGAPPYDFAAKHAIELASPLAPLPKDFPSESERVTAMFYYNSQPPQR